jgi:hypothetical protein
MLYMLLYAMKIKQVRPLSVSSAKPSDFDDFGVEGPC